MTSPLVDGKDRGIEFCIGREGWAVEHRLLIALSMGKMIRSSTQMIAVIMVALTAAIVFQPAVCIGECNCRQSINNKKSAHLCCPESNHSMTRTDNRYRSHQHCRMNGSDILASESVRFESLRMHQKNSCFPPAISASHSSQAELVAALLSGSGLQTELFYQWPGSSPLRI